MKFKCGKLVFNMNCDETWNIPINSKKFIVDTNEEAEINYNIKFMDNLDLSEVKNVISQRENIIISRNDDNELRYLMIPGYPYPYAYYEEINKNNINIYMNSNFKDEFILDTMFWSLFALEKQMIEKECLVLHCSYIKHKEHAILFSGPSGIGKSTQADLWKKYKQVEILNGDKALLNKGRDWQVYGWPVCGSSEICENKKNKLGSIVFLKQGKENKVVKLSKSQAVKNLISQVTINYWNGNFVNKAITLIEDMVEDINVYELTCTPDKDAVETLEQALGENEEWIL